VGREATNGTVTPAPKVAPLPVQIFIHSKILAMACANFTIITPIGLTGAFRLVLGEKTKCRRTTFGLAAFPTHTTATAMHFPAHAGLIFLTDELTNDRHLFDTGATLSIVPCNQNSIPSGPLLKGADGQPIPSWGFIKKTVQFQGKLFTSTFLQAAVAGPILGIDLKKNSKSLFLQKSAKYSLLVQQRPCLPIFCLQRPRLFNQYFQQPHLPCIFCLARHRSRLRF
jgi:hypothetical protein